MFTKQSKSDVYDQITDALISAIEAGTARYSMLWHCVGTPVNAMTQRHYRGVNVLSLWATATKCGFPSQEWATYKQWVAIGAQVKRGARSTVVVLWKFLDSSSPADNQEGDDSPTHSDRLRCFARAYHVFNAEQVEGYQPAPRPQLSVEQRIAHADQFFAKLPIDLRQGGDRAYFDPSQDFIQMPPFQLFQSAESFYAVLGHEAIHWSGSEARLNRTFGQHKGDAAYAFEELVAEIGAAFLCSDLQIAPEPRPDHAAYLTHWLSVLRSDKKAIFTAASKAQAAVTYLHELADLAYERAS